MPHDPEDVIEHQMARDIADLEAQIRTLRGRLSQKREALRLHRLSNASADVRDTMRFAGKRPGNSAIQILKESGAPLEEQEVLNLLVAGGALHNKSRGMVNLETAIKDVVDSGRLKRVGTLLGLPDWPAEKFG